MHKDLEPFLGIAKAIETLLHPHAEVVVHDLKTQKIAAIFNNFSKRSVGDDSLLENEAGLKEFPDFFEPYFKTNWDGRALKSTTATLRDAKGKPIGLLCINLDISTLLDLQAAISLFTNQERQKALPSELFNEDWREKISVYVRDYLKNTSKTMQSLSRSDKEEVIKGLHQAGAFKAKNAASYVADVLHISRATVYKYLAQINSSSSKRGL